MIYTFGKFIAGKVVQAQAVGVHLSTIIPHRTFDLFYVSTHAVFFITILLYGFVFTSLMIGSKMATGKWKPSFTMVWYIAAYSVIAPLWIMRAVFNTIAKRETVWR